MSQIVKKRFDLQVTQANTVVSQTFQLDKNVVAVKGLLVSSDRDDLLYFRGAQKIEINKQEYFPDNYESKLLQSGINVPPAQRYFPLDNVNPGNGSVKMDYKDSNSALAVFAAYRVSLYLDLVIDYEKR